MRSALTITLGLAAAALVIWIYGITATQVTTGPLRDGRIALEKPPQATEEAPLPRPARTLADYAATIQQPLFTADRRPVVRTVKAEQTVITPRAPVTSPEQLQLVGIIQRPIPRALIRSNSTLPGIWIGVGEEIEGWRLTGVEENSAIIEAQNRRFELFLYAASAAR